MDLKNVERNLRLAIVEVDLIKFNNDHEESKIDAIRDNIRSILDEYF